MKMLLLAALFVAALILGALAAAVSGARTMPRYAILSSNDGATIWRVDNRTGQVSLCGSLLTGWALAQAESGLSKRIRAAGDSRAALAALAGEIDETDDLSRPRCSPWSAS